MSQNWTVDAGPAEPGLVPGWEALGALVRWGAVQAMAGEFEARAVVELSAAANHRRSLGLWRAAEAPRSRHERYQRKPLE
jgi:hypothetical protein